MAFINVIPVEQAVGRLEKIYRRIQAPDGQVDNVLQVHSLRPHTLEGHMAIYKAVLHHSSNVLPEWYLEAVGVLVSRLNGCDYCAAHHAVGLRRKRMEKTRMLTSKRWNWMHPMSRSQPVNNQVWRTQVN